MTEVSEASRALPDARIDRLIAWIRQHMCPDLGTPDAKWNSTRVIIFTEYDDTKRYLQQQINAAVAKPEETTTDVLDESGAVKQSIRIRRRAL